MMNIEETILGICQAQGLHVTHVELHGDVAILVPADVETLVDPSTLAGIADEVRQLGIKHVALDIDDHDHH